MTTENAPLGPDANTDGTGKLVVISSHMASGLLGMTGPLIRDGGMEITANWGSWTVSLPEGQHRLWVCTRYLGEMGPATADVVVRAGEVTTVHYRAPATRFSPGAIGRNPPETNGKDTLIVVYLILGLILVASLLGVFSRY